MTDSEWTPSYSPWRHGGWYVDNVRWPNGGCGCVSNSYEDKRWRIVCEPSGTTFPSRDAAARAERVLTLALCSIASGEKDPSLHAVPKAQTTTDDEVFDFCSKARAAGYAITAFTPAELRGCDVFEVTDRLVASGNEFIGDYATTQEA